MQNTKDSQIIQDSSPVKVEPGSLNSVYSQNMPDILTQLGISLVISTYQAGKVIMVQAVNGVITTQFRDFNKPMGIAVSNGHLSIGTQNAVLHYQSVPDLASRYDPDRNHGDFYAPQRVSVTGDIDIHEMAWGTDGLWIVNTKYGALCTLDANQNLTPRWHPHFISALSPEDRCHLNGLAMVDGKPKYVTTFGETDSAGGWRENKRDGGILMDVESNQILTRGLSMPHSPRVYDGKLWVLESGTGGVGWFDPAALAQGLYGSQFIQIMAQLPGFTRGLDFAGPLAFVGLAQVRESSVTTGFPLVERVEDRACGVWVINIYTGETVAFLRFEGEVHEIFAVQVLPALSPEMLAWDDARSMSTFKL
ncbi:MAG: TIGR03032 family protein [Anaerolineales bacterium]|nr:MAG: TIGR03032 family protein [Anaerolineales bacterium]